MKIVLPAGTAASTSDVGIRSPCHRGSFPVTDVEAAKLVERRLRDGKLFAGNALVSLSWKQTMCPSA